MQLTFVLLFAAMVTAFALENGRIFDYTQVAVCARGCSIITDSENVCVPPIAPAAKPAAYLECFCGSTYLKALHEGGEICHDACTAIDSLTIHHYYVSLCESVSLPKAPSPAPSTLTWSQSPTSSSAANEPPATSSPPPTDNPIKAKEPTTWLHSHLKNLLIAGLVGAFVFAVVSCLAWLYWRRQNANTTKANRESGQIPLQLLVTSRLTRSAQPPSRSRTPGSTENLPSTVPASPLAPTQSPYSFGATLRRYAEEERHREEALERRAALAALVRSHSRPNLLPDGV